MRALLRSTAAAAIAGWALSGSPALAQSSSAGYGNPYNPYSYSNVTYSSGLYLPQVPQPTGQDEVRAADGTTCRSSMASNDAYLDVGGLGGQSPDGQFNSGTLYGRLIVPLGGTPRRIDCTALYNLEITRLRNELEMVRSGLSGAPMQGSAIKGGKRNWAEEGWSDTSGKMAAKGDDKPVAKANPRDGVVPSQSPAARSSAIVKHDGTLVPTSAPADAVKVDTSTANHLGGALPPGAPAAAAPEREILPWQNSEGANEVEAPLPAPRRPIPASVTPGEMASHWIN